MSAIAVFTLLVAATLLTVVPGRQQPRQIHPPERTNSGAISDPALMLDLIAAMLAAGQPLPSALSILADAVDPATGRDLSRLLGALDLGLPWDSAWQLAVPAQQSGRKAPASAAASASALPALASALRFTATTGAPSAAVLGSRADAIRRHRRSESQRRAAALGVRLVVPLGVCSLPAFVALSVVPLLMSLVPGWG